jgi:hypothetical protein
MPNALEVIHQKLWITCEYVVVKVSLLQRPAGGGPPNVEDNSERRVAKSC